MGGAALVLGLAHVIMALRLPVRLRVLIPAVENAISGNSYRPLDVLNTRAGITVENGNTDAEGRLVLCDCLTEAASTTPDLLIDVATLTGAARTALGPEVPAVFCSDDSLWQGLWEASCAQGEGLWRLPLYAPYKRMLDSKVADISSTEPSLTQLAWPHPFTGTGCEPTGNELGQAGAITAALFLQHFVKDIPWIHIDTGAYNSGGLVGPGRPEGGEALGLRSIVDYLITRYKTNKGWSGQNAQL